MTLTNQDIADLVQFRRELHRFPEISGEEAETARRVVTFLDDTRPDTVLTRLGGHGVAAVYDSGVPGPTVLFRSELDALPIEELSDAPHRSTCSLAIDERRTSMTGLSPVRRRPQAAGAPTTMDGSLVAAAIALARSNDGAAFSVTLTQTSPGISSAGCASSDTSS